MRTANAGFTLVELLVGLAVAALVLAAATLGFQVGSQTLQGASRQAEAQQNARWTVERMITEIRGAGYDPTATPPTYNFDPIVNQTATSLTLQSDFNGTGVLDPPGVCDPTAVTERVGYRMVGSVLFRSTDPPANTCESAIAGGVSSLSFGYLDADGNVATAPSTIRTVAVSVTMRSEGVGAPRLAVMSDRVRLRNR